MISSFEGKEKTPLHSLSAEQSLLGSMLLDQRIANELISMLDADDFFSEAHQTVFQTMVELSEAGKPVDLVTTDQRLKDMRRYDGSVNAAYLCKLMDAVPTAANGKFYALQVQEKSTFRKSIRGACLFVEEALYENRLPTEELIRRYQEFVLNLPVSSAVDTDDRSTKDLCDEIAWDAIERCEPKGVSGIPTGFRRMDYLTGGLESEEIFFIAGNSSMGKTSFAQNVVANLAPKHKVTYLSLEQSDRQLMRRFISMEAGVEATKISRGVLNNNERDWVNEARERIGDTWKLQILGRTGIDGSDLYSIARNCQRSFGTEVLVIDHIGEMGQDSGYGVMSNNAKAVKRVAKDFKIPVLCLAQLSRRNTNREDKRPQLSDLRDSGRLEEVGGNIVFIHRPGYHETIKPPADMPQEVEFLVAKSRDGQQGLVKGQCRLDILRFWEDSGDATGIEYQEEAA
jgi:replicative DNA helicase